MFYSCNNKHLNTLIDEDESKTNHKPKKWKKKKPPKRLIINNQRFQESEVNFFKNNSRLIYVYTSYVDRINLLINALQLFKKLDGQIINKNNLNDYNNIDDGIKLVLINLSGLDLKQLKTELIKISKIQETDIQFIVFGSTKCVLDGILFKLLKYMYIIIYKLCYDSNISYI